MNCGKSARRCNRRGHSTKNIFRVSRLEFSKASNSFLINSLHRMSLWINSWRVNGSLRSSRPLDLKKLHLLGGRNWTEGVSEPLSGFTELFNNLVYLFLPINLCLLLRVYCKNHFRWVLETKNAVFTTVLHNQHFWSVLIFLPSSDYIYPQLLMWKIQCHFSSII